MISAWVATAALMKYEGGINFLIRKNFRSSKTQNKGE